MKDPSIAYLPDRGVIEITGDDAAHLLDSIVTNALSKLDRQPAIHAGLLSPQGKVLFDFFIIRTGDRHLIETARADIADLIKRLTLYRLRAKARFEDLSDTYRVAAAWNGAFEPPADVIAYPDPREPRLGSRLLVPSARAADLISANAPPDDYDAHRIACGIPEAGRDYALGEAFPHEAMYDLLGSADFSKGCFIGQEVVSRMHHLGTPRNRVVSVEADSDLLPGTDIIADGTRIGRTGSTNGNRGMALVRLDRAHAATEAGQILLAGETPIRLVKPDWAKMDLATGARTQSE
jgi:tRNA-modifying protein YgfZ